jgi:hypothetical protein
LPAAAAGITKSLAGSSITFTPSLIAASREALESAFVKPTE